MNFLFVLCLLSLLPALTACAFADTPPRVAVFAQKGFPFYGPPDLTSPGVIARSLESAGVRAALLDAAALADPARLNRANYDAVVLPYGNTYPAAAFKNLKAFHQAGGCFVLSGIPFTHAVLQDPLGEWRDLGHDSAPALFGPDGIGVGGFRGGLKGAVEIAAGDPLALSALGRGWGNADDAQALDPATLPAGTQVVPLLTAGGLPTAALFRHDGDAFQGAVDVWTTNSLRGGDVQKTFVNEQVMARGALAVLAQKGLLTAARKESGLDALNGLPRPHLYTNITLPSPPRPYPTLQPKSLPPARHLYVADVRKLDRDEQRLLFSLQGLVNRRKPRLYLLHDNDDQFWLDVLQQQGQTGAPTPVPDPLSLLKTFADVYHGAVLPDPKISVSPCVAVDIAGADDLLLATPELATRLHLPIKSDLRGRFKDNADALRCVRTELLPRLNPSLGAVLSPRVFGSQLDDIIAAKGLCFWVTGPAEQDQPGADGIAERVELEALLAQMPLGAIIRGYPWAGDGYGLGERPGVSLFSRFGKIATASDYVANYSVLSGITLSALTQKPQPPAPKLDRTKAYLALAMSDGDNLSTWRGVWRGFFTDPLHGTFPLAYGMGPTLLDVAPSMAQWYYDHAAPTDEFICDVSGAGYVYPQDWAAALKDRPAATARYYDWTQRYMQRLDLKGLRIMEAEPPDIARTGADLPGVPFLMPDYGRVGEKSLAETTYTLPTGQPVFRAVSYGPGSQKLADEIRSQVGMTRPAFVNAFVFLWGANLRDIKGALDLLGPDYVAVTPSQLNTLYRQAAQSPE